MYKYMSNSYSLAQITSGSELYLTSSYYSKNGEYGYAKVMQIIEFHSTDRVGEAIGEAVPICIRVEVWRFVNLVSRVAPRAEKLGDWILDLMAAVDRGGREVEVPGEEAYYKVRTIYFNYCVTLILILTWQPSVY
ncbi:hypothetical protein QBC33DRAFT_518775, partial [Phialemonium atrogriseum]